MWTPRAALTPDGTVITSWTIGFCFFLFDIEQGRLVRPLQNFLQVEQSKEVKDRVVHGAKLTELAALGWVKLS